MSPKKLLIDILASDQRIREYNKNPTKKTADSCIKAYEEAIIKFCEMFDSIQFGNRQGTEIMTLIDRLKVGQKWMYCTLKYNVRLEKEDIKRDRGHKMSMVIVDDYGMDKLESSGETNSDYLIYK